MNEPQDIPVLDLFSGIGGFSLAAEWAGMQPCCQVENDNDATAWLRHRWPNVPKHGDIRTFRGIKCDVVCAGWPCQPWCNGGRKLGRKDARYLWPQVVRVIEESKPSWFLGENTAHLGDVELEAVCADLESIGFEVWPIEVPACAVGAPHYRPRLWIVANSKRQRQQGQGRRVQPFHPAEDAFGEADRFVHAVSSGALPFLCGSHDGLPNDIRERALRLFGESIVPEVAAIFLHAILQDLSRP